MTSEMIKAGMFSKAATTTDLTQTEQIMKRIHEEDPSYWPHGLETAQFDGGLYLISKQANADPVGFVGWQARVEGERRIGYYAIGILPEHRRQGFAKQAVAGIIRENSGSFDEVKAFVMSHNTPSKALARSLSVPMLEKLAARIPKLPKVPGVASGKTQAIHSILGGLGSTAFFDQTNDTERTLESTLKPHTWSKERGLIGGLNFLLGALGGQRMAVGHPGQGIAAIATAPIKDLAIKGQGSLHKLDQLTDATRKSMANPKGGPRVPATSGIKDIPKGVWAGLGGAGLGALGLGLYATKRKADHRKELLKARIIEASKGRVKITLPTKEDGDAETEIELPFDELNLSKALRGRLSRDTRRRLLEETRDRTKKRPAKLTSIAKAAGIVVFADFIHKSAAGINPGPAKMVPSPPQVGQNPALRMQNQEATAKSIDTSTVANPQIMKAEQAAMQAEQQGAQQAAQMEQASQAAQMDQQQKFQAELSKANQEKETLQIQLEKSKAEADLAKQKTDGAASAMEGEGSAVSRLASSRLDRIGSKLKGISKMAMAAAPAPELPSGPPNPADMAPIRRAPGSAQKLNSDPAATKSIHNIGVYRHSYGRAGDWLYNTFLRRRMMTPRAPDRMRMTDYSTMLTSPDKLGMIENLYKRTTSHLSQPTF